MMLAQGTIRLAGFIGRGGNTEAAVRRKLASMPVETIRLEIDSEGGSVGEGIGIMGALSQHPARIVAEVVGTAASMAATIALTADEVWMAPGARLMIHPTRAEAADGDAGIIRKLANFMDAYDASSLAIYCARSRQPESVVKQWMAEERYFTADEAVALGFADGILGRGALPRRPPVSAQDGGLTMAAAQAGKAFVRAQWHNQQLLQTLDFFELAHSGKLPRGRRR